MGNARASGKDSKNTAKRKSGREFSEDPLSDKIGSSLKRMYDDVVNEPVPDDFLSLLAKADSSGANREGA